MVESWYQSQAHRIHAVIILILVYISYLVKSRKRSELCEVWDAKLILCKKAGYLFLEEKNSAAGLFLP